MTLTSRGSRSKILSHRSCAVSGRHEIRLNVLHLA